MAGPKPLHELVARLKKGVNIEEFKEIYPQFLGLKERRDFDSQYDFVEEAVDWFRSVGAFQYPKRPAGNWLSSQQQWVVIKGYFPIWQYLREDNTDELDHKWFVGSSAIKTNVLILDEISAAVWDIVTHNLDDSQGVFRSDNFAWFIILRAHADCAKSQCIRNLWTKFSRVIVDPLRYISPALEVVESFSSAPILNALLKGRQVIPNMTPLFFGGSYHLITAPAWAFNLNSLHSIWNWSYVV